MEVICQAQFDGYDEADAGISAYITNLQESDGRIVTVRVGDDIKIANALLQDTSVTEKLTFHGLRNGEPYTVKCDIYSEGRVKSVCTVMYAGNASHIVCLTGRPKGGMKKSTGRTGRCVMNGISDV